MRLKRCGITADAALFDRFKDKCRANGISASAVISQFMAAYLGEAGFGDDMAAKIAALEMRVNVIEGKIESDVCTNDGR